MQFFHFPPEYKEIRVLQEQPGRRLVLLENQKRKQKLLWRCSDRGNGDVYESLCEIEHPNLRPVYDVCSEGDEVEVLEEYLEGEPLSDLLQQHTMKKADVKRVMIGLCRALEALHGLSIVHRDIKPENVLIGENGQVWLIDYDAARVMDGKEQETRVLGTPGYAAPEQYGVTACENTADIFAMGVLLNMMLCGEHPARKMCRGWAGHIVRKCTRMEPKKRYRSAARLQRACKLLSGRK